jgi:uncharacterized membrane protein
MNREFSADPNTRSNLVVIAFRHVDDANEMRGALLKLQKKSVLDTDDMVVVTRDADGKVHLHQQANLPAMGATFGSFLGLLVGVMFLNPPAGALLGIGVGALSGKLGDIGISDAFMKDVGATLTAGSAALFVLVRKSIPDKVLEGLKPFTGRSRVLQTSLTKDNEELLRRLLEGQGDTEILPQKSS